MFYNVSLKTAKRAISRLFVPAIAIMALVPACSMDEPLEVPASQQDSRAISFRTVGTKHLDTRASILTDKNGANPATYFKVLAADHAPKMVLTDLDNADVTYASGKWTYQTPQAWPSQGNFVDFFATTTNASAGSPDVDYNTTDGTASITYTVPTAAASQADLLLAVHLQEPVPTSGAASPVTLKFQHSLSRILLNVKNTGAADSIKINEVKLLNLKTTGMLAMNNTTVPETGRTYTSTPNAMWQEPAAGPSAKGDYAAAMPGSGVVTKGTNTSTPAADFDPVVGPGVTGAGTDNAIMVLPQQTVLGKSITSPLDASVLTEFYIYLKAEVVDGKGVNVVPEKEFYIAVSDPADDSKPITFEPGRQYTFNLSISTEANFNNNYIVFDDIEVADWDETAGPNADGLVPEEPGLSKVGAGSILPASNRWEKAIVISADAAGRPERIAAILASNIPVVLADITGIGNTADLTAEAMRLRMESASFATPALKSILQKNKDKVLDMAQSDVASLLSIGAPGQFVTTTSTSATIMNLFIIGAHGAGNLDYINSASGTPPALTFVDNGLMMSGSPSWGVGLIYNNSTNVVAILSY